MIRGSHCIIIATPLMYQISLLTLFMRYYSPPTGTGIYNFLDADELSKLMQVLLILGSFFTFLVYNLLLLFAFFLLY